MTERNAPVHARSAQRPKGVLYNSKASKCPEYWAYTIKKVTSDLPTSNQYEHILEQWRKRGVEVHQNVYESDSLRRLHCHGTISIPGHLYRKLLTNYPGYHVLLKPIDSLKDLLDWTHYIEKYYVNKYEQEELCSVSDGYAFGYSFIKSGTHVSA